MADQGADAEVGLLGQFYFAQFIEIVARIPARGLGWLARIVAALAHRVHTGDSTLDDLGGQNGILGYIETVGLVLFLGRSEGLGGHGVSFGTVIGRII